MLFNNSHITILIMGDFNGHMPPAYKHVALKQWLLIMVIRVVCRKNGVVLKYFDSVVVESIGSPSTRPVIRSRMNND